MYHIFIIMLMLGSVCSYAAAAVSNAEIGLLSENEYFGDVPVVLSVTRLAQSYSEAPAAVTVIDRSMIEASGARNITDLFRLVPGFQVAHSDGHKPTVAYHGLSDQFSRRMQVLIDGRSAYGPLSGGVFWADTALSIDDIERIEVIRGPNTAAYGSNAFLGVINISTRHASQDNGHLVKITSGDHGAREVLWRTGWKAKADMRLSLGNRQDNGFNDRPDSEKSPFINFRGDMNLNASNSLSFEAGLIGGTRGQGFFGDITFGPHDSDVRSHFEHLRWHRNLSTDQEMVVQFFHNYRKSTERYLTEPLDIGLPQPVQVPVNFDATDERYDVEFQHSFSHKQFLRFVWGGGARLDRVQGRVWFDTDEYLDNKLFRLFGNTEWRATRNAIFNIGAMVEKSDLTDVEISPRLALNYHLNPNHSLRVSASGATRLPTLTEDQTDQKFFFQNLLVEYNRFSPGGLESEKLISYEVGYLGSSGQIPISWEARFYRNRLRDIITETRIPSPLPELNPENEVFSFINNGRIDVDGAEFELNVRASRDTRLIFNFAAMRSSASGFSTTIDIVNGGAKLEQSVPSFSGSFLLMFRLSPKWMSSVFYYRVDDMRWLGDGDMVPGFSRLDCRLARQFKLAEAKGEFAVTVQNVASDYIDFSRQNTFDTRLFATLKFSL